MNAYIKRPAALWLTWRAIGTTITITLVYYFTRRPELAAMVGGAELLIKLFVWRLHEYAWSRFPAAAGKGAPFVLWFTGLSGSGKSTIADALYRELNRKGYRVTRLDGDTVRSVFPETGFTREERNNHIRRIGYLASMLEKNGTIVISSFVSPYAESRDFVRSLCDNFIEVYVSTSLPECERRDVKGLYRRARAGEIQNFTGISDPFEPPANPELTMDTAGQSVDESIETVMSYIGKYL